MDTQRRMVERLPWNQSEDLVHRLLTLRYTHSKRTHVSNFDEVAQWSSYFTRLPFDQSVVELDDGKQKKSFLSFHSGC